LGDTGVLLLNVSCASLDCAQEAVNFIGVFSAFDTAGSYGHGATVATGSPSTSMCEDESRTVPHNDAGSTSTYGCGASIFFSEDRPTHDSLNVFTQVVAFQCVPYSCYHITVSPN